MTHDSLTVSGQGVLLLTHPPWQQAAAAAVIVAQPIKGAGVYGLLLLLDCNPLLLLLVLLLLVVVLVAVPLLILPMRFSAGTKRPKWPSASCRQDAMGRQLALLVPKRIT